MSDSSLPTSGGYAGQIGFGGLGTPYQDIDFLVRQIIAGKAHAALVKVISVQGGGISTPSIVAVQPMTNQQDFLGNQTPHGVIYNIPCFRLQGGEAAFIVDPVPGDIGQAIICDRDISTVKATGQVSPPGSWRQHSWSDGCYFGGFLGAPPTQYVQITQSGINIVTTGNISMTAGGTISITGSGGTSIDGKPFLPHEHSGVTVGGGHTGGVV